MADQATLQSFVAALAGYRCPIVDDVAPEIFRRTDIARQYYVIHAVAAAGHFRLGSFRENVLLVLGVRLD
jgi:hypothetical protein